jgi:uncharacterized Zn finger protein (UPF0148 family)
MFCQKCGTENKEGASFCNSCGADLRLTPAPVNPAPEPIPEPIPCISCGTMIPFGEIFCPNCLVRSPWADIEKPEMKELDMEKKPEKPVAKTKHNEIILAKIATKKREMEDTTVGSNLGPILVGIVGVCFCLSIIGIPIGLIIIGIAYWWHSKRTTQWNKLKNEIKELEVEIE